MRRSGKQNDTVAAHRIGGDCRGWLLTSTAGWSSAKQGYLSRDASIFCLAVTGAAELLGELQIRRASADWDIRNRGTGEINRPCLFLEFSMRGALFPFPATAAGSELQNITVITNRKTQMLICFPRKFPPPTLSIEMIHYLAQLMDRQPTDSRFQNYVQFHKQPASFMIRR